MDVNTQCPRCAAPRQHLVRDGHFFVPMMPKRFNVIGAKPVQRSSPAGVAPIPAFGHLAQLARKMKQV